MDACRSEQRDWQILLLLFAVAFLVRLIRLFYLDVWFDEVAIIFQTQMSWAEIWNFSKSENFPPLYSWLLKLWKIFGASDAWMRLFSAVIGAAVAPAAYLLGREIRGKRLGLMLGLACIISVPLYYYSQMIRMYGLFALMACLSYYGFLRALRTGEWRYWILNATANLAGFYTFLFMAFPIFSHFLVLIYFFRLDLKRYWRPALAHLMALGLMSFWTVALLTRYQAMQSYLAAPMVSGDIVRLWIFLGTGYAAPSQMLWIAVTNLPLLLGLLLGIRRWKVHPGALAVGLIGGISLLTIVVFSLRHSIFISRYMLFLLPIYLALALFGWMELHSRTWGKIGIALVFGVLLFAQGFYWSHYHEAVDYLRLQGTYKRPRDDDGRSMSRMAALIRERLQSREVVIHYSSKLRNSLSFFTLLYYHNHSLPEYVYSLAGIPQYAGQQYLLPGERIKSLRDLPQLPDGIWVITLNPPYVIMKGSYASREAQWIIAEEGDLPGDLRNCGYALQETIRDGAMNVLHFRRLDREDLNHSSERKNGP